MNITSRYNIDHLSRDISWTVQDRDARRTVNKSKWSSRQRGLVSETFQYRPDSIHVTWCWDMAVMDWVLTSVMITGRRVKVNGEVGFQSVKETIEAEDVQDSLPAEVAEAITASRPTFRIVEAW